MLSVRRLEEKKEVAYRKNALSEVVDLCFELGQVHLDEGRNGQALEEFAAAERVSTNTVDRLNVAQANRKIGEVYIQMDEFKKALIHQHKFLQIAREIRNTVEIQRALTTIGQSYLLYAENIEIEEDKRSKLDKADTFCQQAMDAIGDISEDYKDCNQKEKKQMRAILLTNLFRIYWRLDRQFEYEAYFEEAQTLMKLYNLTCDLARLYDIRANLLFESGKYDGALETSEKMLVVLNNLRHVNMYSYMLSDMQTLRGYILLHLYAFERSRDAFVAALKATTNNKHYETMLNSIKKPLKNVIRFLGTFEKLQNSSNDEQGWLNERLGDLCCRLELYNKALEYYHRALDIAFLSAEMDAKVMSGLYTSLAKTYQDLLQYETALNYYMKELELSRGINQAEAFQSCLSVAECMKAAGYEYERQMQYLVEAKCYTQSNIRKDAMVLGKILTLQVSYDMTEEAELTRIELKAIQSLNYDSTDEAVSEESEEDDISISEYCGFENTKKRQRIRQLRITKNLKGESTLHTKCQKEGNLNDIEKLLKQGHPVDIMCYSGFTPLHEACNHGMLPYVECLVKWKADINRRVPDTQLTPLMDAAANGHIYVVEYLLEVGARVYDQDADGWTVTDHLQNFIDNGGAVDFRCDDTKLLDQLMTRMKKLIQDRSSLGIALLPKRKDSTVFARERTDTNIVGENGDAIKFISSKFHPAYPSSSSDEKGGSFSFGSQKSHENIVVSDYQNVMKHLARRKPLQKGRTHRSKSINIRPHFESDIGDDWLDDDISSWHQQRKRKRTVPNEENGLSNIVAVEDVECCLDVSTKSQSCGHVTVCIGDNMRFLIALPPEEEVTWEWLTREAAHRHFMASGLRPVLSLKTKDGAEFCSSDYLPSPFCYEEIFGSVLRWEISVLSVRFTEACTAQKIRTPHRSLVHRLEDAATTQVLNMGDGLCLSDLYLKPFLLSLKGESNLTRLDLSNNDICDENMILLGEALATLSSLNYLDLKGNRITARGLGQLKDVLISHSDTPLGELTYLCLSHNPLTDAASDSLVQIFEHSDSHLQYLYLASCRLGPDFFVRNRSRLKQVFGVLCVLSLAMNPLLEDAEIKFLMEVVSYTKLRSIDISGCGNQSQVGHTLTNFVKQGQPDVNLSQLTLSNLYLTDKFLKLFCCSTTLHHLGNLHSIDLSFNPAITWRFVAEFLQLVSIQNVPLLSLNIRGSCLREAHVAEHLEAFLESLAVKMMSMTKLNQIMMTYVESKSNYFFIARVIDIWNKAWNKRSCISKGSFARSYFVFSTSE